MSPRHRRTYRAIGRARRVVRRIDRRLVGLEVAATQGYKATRQARDPASVFDWESARSTSTPCFTLSAGRSGTMTLAQLGELCDELESVHEPMPHLLTESYLAHRGDVADDQFWEEVVAEARDWPIRDALHRGRTWFETNNRLTFLAGALARHYPQSKYIVLARHPVPFAESGIARGYFRSHPWDFARVRPREGDAARERWAAMSQLEHIGWLWNETYVVARRLAEAIGADRVLLVQAEDLFAARYEVVDEMFRFSGVRQSPPSRAIADVLGRQANAQIQRPVGSNRAEWGSASTESFLRLVEPSASWLSYELG